MRNDSTIAPTVTIKPGAYQTGSSGETDESGRMHWTWSGPAVELRGATAPSMVPVGPNGEGPTVSAYWCQPEPGLLNRPGYWVVQIDGPAGVGEGLDETTPVRVYVNDGSVYQQ